MTTSLRHASCRVPRSWRHCAIAMALGGLSGCYDAALLVQEQIEAQEVSRLEEVDLGTFSITLPHTLGDSTDCIVDFHAFGQVSHADREALDHALLMRGPELRARMLLEVRSLRESTFEEPELATLRKAVAEVINGALGKPLIKRVGFYQFTFTTI